MQVTETLVDGLKREFKVVVPATELDGRLIERLNSLKDEVRIKGFRPGKVPMSHLKRLFGRSAMAEIVQDVISEVARNTLSERGEKAAMQPHYELPEDQGEANEVLAGNHDLAYTMSYEVLPKIELIDFKTISVERPTVEVADAEVEEQLTRLADSTRSYTTKAGAGRYRRPRHPFLSRQARRRALRRRQRRQRRHPDRRQAVHPGLRGAARRPLDRRQEDHHRHLPGGLRGIESGRQGSHLRHRGEGGGRRRRGCDRRQAGRASRSGVAAKPARHRAPAASAAIRPGDPPAGQAADPRPARRDAPLRAARAPRRPGVRDHLAPDRRRALPNAGAPSRTRTRPRRRRGRTTRRSPSAACASAW